MSDGNEDYQKEYYAQAILNNNFYNRIELGAFPSLEEAEKCFLDFVKNNKGKFHAISSLYGAREKKAQ